MEKYNIVIPISFMDSEVLKKNLPYIIKNLEHNQIIIIGNEEVYKKLNDYFSDEILFINENELIEGMSFSSVASLLEKRCKKRRRAGWYLQQFLKLGYAYICKEKYYLVWDADTIPLHPLSFIDGGKTLFNLKDEYNKPYFDTIKKLFDIPKGKLEKKSFISEHMLFDRDIVIEMLEKICENSKIDGNSFYEKIIYSIPRKSLNKSGFSEFETYGTYCMMFHPDIVSKRFLSTLRYGKRYLGDNPPLNSLLWAANDYDTISFEKFDKELKKSKKYNDEEFQKTNSLKKIYEKELNKLTFINKFKMIIRNFIR